MKILYFAWVREKVGKSEENIKFPETVTTVSDLMKWLSKRNEGYKAAFSEPEKIRAALDHTFVNHDHKIEGAEEVAFFPPVTGG